MRIIFVCEKTQAVTLSARRLGHEAFSCDILPCSGGHPEWHLQMDCFEALKNYGPWDRVISFQPCTDLAVSGAKHFWYKRANGQQERSIRFFFEVWKLSDACENPIGILNGGNYINKWFPYLHNEMLLAGFPFKPTQIIQPWQFGHGETKATCIWIRTDLQPLQPTNIVEGREPRIWKLPPTPDRGDKRSETYTGIAEAMALQWFGHVGCDCQKPWGNPAHISAYCPIHNENPIKKIKTPSIPEGGNP